MRKLSTSGIFLLIIAIIIAFKLTEWAFWLMNQRSTLLNMGGLLLLTAPSLVLLVVLTKKSK